MKMIENGTTDGEQSNPMVGVDGKWKKRRVKRMRVEHQGSFGLF